MGRSLWKVPETWKVRDSQDTLGVTLAQMPKIGRRNLKSLPPVDRQGLKWRDRVTNLQSKILTQNCSCLKELQGQKWRRDSRKGGPMIVPNLGSNSWRGTKARHYYQCFDVLTDSSLAWLSSDRSYQQLTETEADTYIQPID